LFVAPTVGPLREASAQRFGRSISSADNDVYGQTGLDLSQYNHQLGASINPHLSVLAFINGATINCKLRLGYGDLLKP